MKVSDGCHCGVNMILASRTGLVRQPKSGKTRAGGVQKHSRLQYNPLFIRNKI